MNDTHTIWCNNASCAHYSFGECTYDGAMDVKPNPESNADCLACDPCWFEWE